jgi:predicted GNAT superfamily acetyltransferase
MSPPPPDGRLGPVVLRPFSTPDDYRQCLVLQDQAWGERFSERASVAMLMGTQRVGGVAAGAFDDTGQLLGFVFGFNGVREGVLAHWSYMLAVRRAAQGYGLGRQLKAYQRECLLALGIEVAYWTYDPLVAANAHLNLNRLGARATQYVPDMYGADTGSDLHRQLGTDRFVVAWQLTDPRVDQALARGLVVDPTLLARAPVVTARADAAAAEPELPDTGAALVEIPEDILEVRDRSPGTAARWRATTRRAFIHYLGRGYAVSGFHRDREEKRSAYLLARPPRPGDR